MSAALTEIAPRETIPQSADGASGWPGPTPPAISADRLFLAFIGILLSVGVLMVYSASVTSRPTEFERVYLLRHLAAAGVGLLAAGVVSQLSIRQWRVLLPWLFAGICVLLVAVLIPGIGTSVKGARRWLRIAGISMQPSELAKLVLPLWTCLLITRRLEPQGLPDQRWSLAQHSPDQQRLSEMKTPGLHNFIAVLWPTLVLVPLVFLEPDLGTSVFLVLGTGISLFLAGWPLRWFWASLAICVPACAGLLWLKPYQWRRIAGFMETWQDLDAAPYQVKQSLVTLGAGGWWGTGLGKGWQKLSFLPEANTDFVFSVIGEELGLSGTLGVIALWCGIYLSGQRLLSRRDPRSFEFLAGTTLLSQLVIQAMMNVAVVTAMLPPKGIAHPLISAGGSNLVVSLMILGAVWGLSREPWSWQAAKDLPSSPGEPAVELPISGQISGIESENPPESGGFSL